MQYYQSALASWVLRHYPFAAVVIRKLWWWLSVSFSISGISESINTGLRVSAAGRLSRMPHRLARTIFWFLRTAMTFSQPVFHNWLLLLQTPHDLTIYDDAKRLKPSFSYPDSTRVRARSNLNACDYRARRSARRLGRSEWSSES